MPIAARRGSQNLRTTTSTTDTKSAADRPPTDPNPNSKHESLSDRASSKLTLDDELFDILYAFGIRLTNRPCAFVTKCSITASKRSHQKGSVFKDIKKHSMALKRHDSEDDQEDL
ncbi:hypothetical protein TELCIR_01771 [Teladorsagia circumcincta]|uniref:Uncharacterized protein n=1 Tax=Teladorsagia circumcincta TaxID=45464 RepID=A0A2G9V115_TELCI|nr:hypothetical protein TELCIR_01771 [Teladorsagia circumcincta]